MKKSTPTTNLVPDFISSFSYDNRLAIWDIKCSIAHITMLAKKKIIPPSDGKRLLKTLKAILTDLLKGKKLTPAEDIHYAVEKEVIRRVGEELGGKLRTARSRNDQVATDIRLYIKSEIAGIVSEICSLRRAIIKKSLSHIDIVMPGYTHLQQAQPILFSHYLSTYNEMLKRDECRFNDCLKRMDESPLGAAALAGTSYPIDRNITAHLLGFSKPMSHSVDAVSSRDFACEFISCCAITLTHLSRMSEDLIIFSSSEFGFVTMPPEFSSGSSIMPQKRNPDWLEIIRAKTSAAIGSLTAILSLLKGLPLSYNRDMQEDKLHIFRSSDDITLCLKVMTGIISGMKINQKRIAEALERNDYYLATELADYLVSKGISFKTAHNAVSRLVSLALSRGLKLSQIPLEDYKKISTIFSKINSADIRLVLNVKRVINSKKSYGGTSPLLVKKYLLKELSELNQK